MDELTLLILFIFIFVIPFSSGHSHVGRSRGKIEYENRIKDKK